MKKVFISSVVEGFEEFRHAAKSAVELMDYKAVMCEDFSARSYSSEVACIHEVMQSDIYLVILGEKYGFVTGDGISVTCSEFIAAKQSSKPILAFTQICEMEDKQKAFKTEVENYSEGVFRATFREPGELKDKIIQALRHIDAMEQAVTSDDFQDKINYAVKKLSDGRGDHPEFALGFLPQPEKMIDIVTLENELDNIFKKMCEAGLATFKGGYDVIEESDFTGLIAGKSKISYFSDGLIVYLTNPTRESSGLFSNHFVPPEDLLRISQGLFKTLKFTAAHAYIGLHVMDSAYVAEPPSGTSMSMRMRGKEKEEFSRLFVPVTVGAYNDWIQLCVNRFSRTFKYK